MIALVSSMLVAVVLPTTWIVDASNGPGTSFTSLPAAVAAAASGDTLIVRSGTYAPFNVTGKALTIRGAGSGSTFVITAVTTQQTVIASVPAGLTFYLSGMAFGPAPSAMATNPNPAIQVSGPGTVVISDAVMTGFNGQLGGSGLWVDGGAVVHVTRCSSTAGATWFFTGTAGAFVSSGSVLAADASTFTGGLGGASLYTGGNGLLVQGGTATLSRCNVTGGGGGFPGIGVRAMMTGFVRIAGTGANVIQGGAGVSPYSISADPNASVVVHGPVVLSHPTAGSVTTGAPALPYVSITGTSAGNGELLAASPVTVTFQGIPFEQYYCAVDTVPWYSTAYSSLAVGELLIHVPAVPTLQGTFDASGILQFSATPSVTAPGLIDLPIYLQIGVVDSAAGNIRLSNGLVRVFKS